MLSILFQNISDAFFRVITMLENSPQRFKAERSVNQMCFFYFQLLIEGAPKSCVSSCRQISHLDRNDLILLAQPENVGNYALTTAPCLRIAPFSRSVTACDIFTKRILDFWFILMWIAVIMFCPVRKQTRKPLGFGMASSDIRSLFDPPRV